MIYKIQERIQGGSGSFVNLSVPVLSPTSLSPFFLTVGAASHPEATIQLGLYNESDGQILGPSSLVLSTTLIAALQGPRGWRILPTI